MNFFAPIVDFCANSLPFLRNQNLFPIAIVPKREDCFIEISYLTEWEQKFDVASKYLYISLVAGTIAGISCIIVSIAICFALCVCCICTCFLLGCGTTFCPCLYVFVRRGVKKQRNIEKQRLLQGLLEDKELGNVDTTTNEEKNISPLDKIDISLFNLNFDDYKIEKDIGEFSFFLVLFVGLTVLLVKLLVDRERYASWQLIKKVMKKCS